MTTFWRRVSAIAALVGAALVSIAGTPIPASAAIVYDTWESLGGIITGAPDVVQRPDGSLVYFATGIDQAVWMKEVSPDGTPQEWTTLGGIVKGGVGASNAIASASNDTGRIDVFVIGTDNAVWYRTFTGSDGMWTEWDSIGGIATSDPTAMAFGDPDDDTDTADFILEVLVRGTDNALWNKAFVGGPGGGWTDWQSLGGILRGGPGAGGNPTAYIGNVAVRGVDDGVWFKDYDAETGVFSEWFTVGGKVNEDPEGEYLCTSTFFGRGLDNGVWTKSIDPDTGWESLGGLARSGPGTHEMVFTNGTVPDGADWVAAVRGNNNSLWTRRHQWFPDAEHCLADSGSGSGSGSGGGGGGPNRKPPKAAG